MIYHKPTNKFFKNRLEARKHFAWYLRGVSHSSYYKTQISAISCMDDVERIAKGIKQDLK